MKNLKLMFESGDESLSVRSFRVEEALNALFTVAVTARSLDPDLELARFVGLGAELYLPGSLDQSRTWTGICTRMEQVRVEPMGLSTYDLTIMPRLWLLTQRRNHRIFQHQSIPDVLDKLLAEWGIEPVWQIDRGSYPSLELRIQYGESDFAFLSRLVEEAGITFFFVYDLDEGSRLVFDDRPQAAEARLLSLPFVDAPETSQAGRLEYITAVRVSDQVRPGKHVVRDFDFRRPAHRLFGDASAGSGTLDAMLEQYHYLPGAALAETGKAGSTPVGDDKGVGRHADATGQSLAQRALDSHRALKRAVRYQTSVLDLAPGVVFSITTHPRSDLAADKMLLVVQARFEGNVGEEWTYSGKALFADQAYYPAHVTVKPRIHGVQSAVVVGPDGQEIHTDEYGRVRVQFHWDREGELNEESFVWIRVSQGWAGGGYGMLSLPRVGHEVLVQFMDGDPDSPLVVGRAFNATMTVPYPLPEHKTVSTWRSASSPGADGFNEIKMEDKKGQELLYLQAEKDHARLVKNDEVSLIGNDRTKLVEHDEMSSIKNDRVKVVQHDERVSVQNDRTGLVGNDEHLAVGRDRVAQIKRNETLAVGANHATQVGKSASLAVGENRAAHIGKSDQVSVGENQSVTVGQSRSSTIGINDSTLVGSQYSVTIANGLGGKVSGILGKLLDGSVLDSLGSIAAPLLAGPMQQVMGALNKGPFGDTPLTTFMRGPMATLQAVLPGKLQQVASMMSGPLSSMFGAEEQPTSFSMVDKKITLTTGDATIQLEGGKITLSAKEGIFLQAGQVIDLTAGMMIQAQADVLVKIQAGPTPVPQVEAPPGANVKADAPKFDKKPKPPVGDLVLVGMKQVEIGAKELMVLGSKKEMMLIAEQNLAMSGEKGVTIVSASGETVIKGTMVQLNPPSAKSDSAEEQKAEPSDASIDSEAALEHDVEDTLLGSADEEGEEFGYPDVSGGEGEIGGDGGGDGAGGAKRAMEIGKFAEQGGGVLAAVAGGLSKGDRGDRSKESTDDSGKDLERQPGKSLEGLGLSDDKPGDLLEGGSGEDRILLAGNPTRQKLTLAQEEQIRVLREEAMKGVAEGTKEGEWGNNLQRAAAFMHGFSSTATPTYSALVALMRVTGIINANEYNEMSKPSAELAVGTFLGAIVGYAAATSAETAGANLLVSKNGLRWFTGRGGESLVQLINPISGRRLTMTIKEFYDLSVLFSTAAGGAVNISF